MRRTFEAEKTTHYSSTKRRASAAFQYMNGPECEHGLITANVPKDGARKSCKIEDIWYEGELQKSKITYYSLKSLQNFASAIDYYCSRGA
jgi:hypothetical protein